MMRLSTSLMLAHLCFYSQTGCSALTPSASTNIAEEASPNNQRKTEAEDLNVNAENAGITLTSLPAASQKELAAITAIPEEPSPPEVEAYNEEEARVKMLSFCSEVLAKLPGRFDSKNIQELCQRAELLANCESVEKRPIFHYNAYSSQATSAKRVLVMAVVHGDEPESGSVARRWVERLMTIESRNTWRIIPILNPDGLKRYQRTNVNGVDLNRNFPSGDWDELALKWWKEKRKSNPRQYPGPSAGSEPETQCALRHIEDFKPDFIVAIHTPYGVLDFDGPQIKTPPRISSLPWVSLGTFPGSLGRYMWKDHNIPVLTVELKDADILKKIDDVDALQDIAGTVAIRSVDSL